MGAQVINSDIKDKIQELESIATDLYDASEDFPALNRNLKRILASVEMLKINTETLD
jgi:hypothetical protein